MDLDHDLSFEDTDDGTAEPWPVVRMVSTSEPMSVSAFPPWQWVHSTFGLSDPCPFPTLDLFPRLSRLARWMRRRG